MYVGGDIIVVLRADMSTESHFYAFWQTNTVQQAGGYELWWKEHI